MTGETLQNAGDLMRVTCGAKTRAGTPCQIPPVNGRTRCRLHGGATPRGPAIGPAFKHGRYSRDLPTRLAARLAESEADPNQTSVREEAALIQTRITDLLERLDQDMPETVVREIWREIQELIEHKRKLAESEIRRVALSQRVMTPEQAAVLTATLTDAVFRNVHDRDTLEAIRRDIASVWERGTGGHIEM
jgi:hypothetical protein